MKLTRKNLFNKTYPTDNKYALSLAHPKERKTNSSSTENNDQKFSLNGIIKTSRGLCEFSPNGSYAAFVFRNSVVVCTVPKSESDHMKILSRRSTIEGIDLLEWSSDSSMMLCGQFKNSLVQVFSVSDVNWSCRVKEGVSGMIHACFAPDSLHILTVADFQLHITVWSLCTEQQFCIEYPKHCSGTAGYSFNSNGIFLAVLRRRECKDSVAIYSVNCKWRELINFPVESTDAEELKWSPTSDIIVVRDSPMDYGIFAYNPSSGDMLGRFSAYENALGARCMVWASDASALAIGSFDGKLRVLSSATWRPIFECSHPSSVEKDRKTLFLLTNCPIFDCNAHPETEEKNHDIEQPKLIRHKFQLLKSDPKKEFPREGVFSVHWSFDSSYLVTRDEEKLSVVWIWQPAQFEPYALLDFQSKVHSVKWNPCRNRLAIATGQPFAFIWEPDRKSVV